MFGEEVCIVVVPNDFPNDDNHHGTSTVNGVIRGEERRQSKDNVDKQYDAISTLEQLTSEKSKSSTTINRRKSSACSALSELHTREYSCPECAQSMASRFRYHVIPKLQLRDTSWIPTNNNKTFFILCYTELGPQSDGILDELRRAEIGIRAGTKVFIIPLNCALGVRKVVSEQKTLPVTKHKSVTDDEELNMLADGPWPSRHRSPSRFVRSIRARLTVQKVVDVRLCFLLHLGVHHCRTWTVGKQQCGSRRQYAKGEKADCHQGNHWQSLAIIGNQWQSMAIIGNQWQSLAINGNRWQSMAIVGNQWQSLAINGNHPESQRIALKWEKFFIINQVRRQLIAFSLCTFMLTLG